MPSELDLAIGWRLRIRRRLLGLTQKDVAVSVGVTPQMVHKWETAQSTVYAATVFALAQALGVTPSYFFLDVEPRADRPEPSPTPPPPPVG
jgi:transcriptional regulator with XRE-family HTH domain